MKHLLTLLFSLNLLIQVNSQTLKPYILGAESSKSLTDLKTSLSNTLESQGFKIVGAYVPAADNKRMLFVISHPQLTAAVKKIGGLTGLAATLRVAITLENGASIVSYTNPPYWGNAYFRNDYPKVETNYNVVIKALDAAMRSLDGYRGTVFGSKDGEEIEDLREYQYMMGMPDFDDTEELTSFDSYKQAIAKIDANLKNGIPNAKLVYKISIPNKNLTVYGIALSGEDGESSFLSKIDISSPKHTAFLPYEILVMDNEVHMLHGRFRIALAFPDLTMGTFTKIMSTPGDIEDMMKEVVK